MRALHEAGHGAEALDRYADIRQRLVDELGTEPGAELRGVHQQILRSGAGAAPAPPLVPAGAPVPAAAQLPLDLHSFTGRDAELARLDAILDAGGQQPWAVVIAAIFGTAGVGKTSLAVHWAHRVADRFPGGQLYANLHGFDEGDASRSPVQAVRGFLDALDVPPGRIPADFTAQTALYRSLLAGRQMLIVLDNSRDADQVRPLLPGGPGCVVVVTSRTQLTGLVATEGAHPVPLDVPTRAEAGRLLARRLGQPRLAAEPRAVDEIIEACARLPLALAIVAARAVLRPVQPLAELADELRDTDGGLDPFDAGDARGDVRAVLSWSYRTLSEPAARLFRLLGLHPGPDVSGAAVASLAGIPVRQCRALLTELTRAHLLTEPAPDRYTWHDLLRRYAGELVRAVDTEEERRAATRRLLDHYLHTAYAATMLMHPYQLPIPAPTPAAAGVGPGGPDDQAAALRWIAAEYPVLLAAVRHAASTGFDAHAWQLAWALTIFMQRQGHNDEWLAVHTVALAAARRLGDRLGQAHLHRTIARAYHVLGRHDDSHDHFVAALELLGELGDGIGEATTYLNLAEVLEAQHRYDQALARTEQALRLYRTTDRESGLAYALNAAAWYNVELGRGREAVDYGVQALALQERIEDRHGQAATLDTLGFAHHRLGQHQESIRRYRRAIELTRDLSDGPSEAGITDRLGDALWDAGDPTGARAAWRRALDIFEEIGHADAGRLRAKLDRAAIRAEV
jgi:tetratricopeptide (TPR) repeat protein